MAKGHFGPGMGRPSKIPDDPQKYKEFVATFETLMGIAFVTEEAVADVLRISISTMSRWLKKEYNCTFDELKAQKQSNMKLKLAGKQYETAMKGSVPMQIWLGKQWLGQSDKQEVSNTEEIKIVISKEDEGL